MGRLFQMLITQAVALGSAYVVGSYAAEKISHSFDQTSQLLEEYRP